MTVKSTTTTTERTAKVLMFSVTEPWANFLYNWANILVAVGAALGLIGVIGIFAMGSAKEQFSSERISANEASTARAHAEAEQAREGAATANERAARFELELARLKAARTLSTEQKSRITNAMAEFTGQKYSGMVAASVADAAGLWAQIADALFQAKWEFTDPWGYHTGAPPAGVPLRPGDGITIFVPTLAGLSDREIIRAAKALSRALNDEGLKTVIVADNGPQARAGVIVIEIGTKPMPP